MHLEPSLEAWWPQLQGWQQWLQLQRLQLLLRAADQSARSLCFSPFETVLLSSWHTGLSDGLLGEWVQVHGSLPCWNTNPVIPIFCCKLPGAKELSLLNPGYCVKINRYLCYRKHWERRAWICCLELRKSIWDEVDFRYCLWLQICLSLLK